MNLRICSCSLFPILFPAVVGTSLFAPAVTAKNAAELQEADAQRPENDDPADETEQPGELLLQRQYEMWDRSISRFAKPFKVNQTRVLFENSYAHIGGHTKQLLCEQVQIGYLKLVREALVAVWPHAPPHLA